MPVPSNISDLSTTPADNSPPGTESPSTADDYLRTLSAFIAQLYDADAAHVAAADPHPAYALESDVSATLANYAPKASPALTGVPTAPTAAAGTNTTQLATTEFVQAIAAKSSGGIRGQVFTSSGTFTVPAGVTAVKVRGCGGGSGGGSSPGNGGTTSFGAYCSATGGSGATPGTGAGGDINLDGGAGGKTIAAAGAVASGGALGGGRGGGGGTSNPDQLVAPTGLLGGSGHSTAAATGYGNGGGCSAGTATIRPAGHAGGYFEGYITGLTPGAAITVTIGQAGAAGTDGRAGAPGICVVEW